MNMMKPLDKSLRNSLEHAVVEARDIAETAARAALEQLGVGEAIPFSHLTEENRELRRKLRAHGRQLGDIRNSKSEQEISRLIDEISYEHWHRMLFARFLAENNLLMYPDPENPVPVTLEECEDLASQDGAQNGWELASRFATRMLPQIFRPESPIFQIVLPPEYQQRLERLVTGIPNEIFTASDSLGWVYQFWQAKKKDEINASEVKIGARELPAVTQLFTEPYMVSFLLDNSLGSWWAARQLTEDDLKNAESEDELRVNVALPNLPLQYLRFAKKNDGTWIPAAGTFDSWPEHLSEFNLLDPCCGSGHFLVAAFLMLVPMRMELEGLSANKSVEAVLKDNIHGLELDQRCVELAAFTLALTAWRYPNAGGFRPLPDLNVACSGLGISSKKEEWLNLAGKNHILRTALEELYLQFKNSPLLGSLIYTKIGPKKDSLFELKWQDIVPLLDKVLSDEKSEEKTEMGVVARGIVQAFSLINRKYDLVCTNVPYLVRGKHNELLKCHLDQNFSRGKHDLAYAFLDRSLRFLEENGNISLVLPENLLYINPCKNFRKDLINNSVFKFLIRLGPGAFQTISGEVVKGLLLSLTNTLPNSDNSFFGIDLWEIAGPKAKSKSIKNHDIRKVRQTEQINNPDHRISLGEIESGKLLSTVAEGLHGQGTFDKSCFVFQFWEISNFGDIWVPQQSTPNKRDLSDFGASQIFRWEQGRGLLYEFMMKKKESGYSSGKWKAGVNIWGSKGIAVSGIGYLYVRPYLGKAFDENIAVIHPNNLEHLPSIRMFVESNDFTKQLKQIDGNLKASCNTLVKVPFDLDYWNEQAKGKYPNGIPKHLSNDPSQWIFHGHPATSDMPLQVAVARLLGYRWPAELEYIDELSDDAQAWVKKSESLLLYADLDGIVCIPPVRGEASGVDRLLNLLATAYDSVWNNNKLVQLLGQVNHAGKTLETWLRNKFFTQHCKLFHHKPFIWQIWDGLHEGFSALINYHKFDAKLLESFIYVYLGDWIIRQKQDKANGVDGAEEKLAAAENLKKSLELILKGETPYDIFVRWKPIEKQSIGWNPDLNDGVRLNIRPFLTVPDVGRKDAGILRDKPNINWNKDRGKDVESAPWYHLGPLYGGREGDRINDHHLSLAEKRKAKEKS